MSQIETIILLLPHIAGFFDPALDRDVILQQRDGEHGTVCAVVGFILNGNAVQIIPCVHSQVLFDNLTAIQFLQTCRL